MSKTKLMRPVQKLC